MDYPLENLSPEKFQELIQALVASEYKNVQCFPVAQPDGGRDIVSYTEHRRSAGQDFIMFQVKFVRDLTNTKEPHKQFIETVKKEINKVKNQVKKGAKQYILITNVKGTAHPEVGSIDIVKKLLSDALDVPVLCWWRDDINRRLDNAWDLKWRYNELMIGADLIRLILEKGLTEKQEQRSTAVKAYVKQQFNLEKDVRFKQVELQNNLINLYIDVPIGLTQINTVKDFSQNNFKEHVYKSIVHSSRPDSQNENNAFDDDWVYYQNQRERLVMGSASFLLHPMVHKHFPYIVIEGAPGQGKSTITQYVAQLHRIKVLNKLEFLSDIPSNHKDFPVKLPIRIDLRDLSIWLSKKNPFTQDDKEPTDWAKSVESFIAASIKNYSGGIDFNTYDLYAVAKISSLLLIFDGLDEVPDIVKRQEVIDEITASIGRLEEDTTTLQVIITSRPSSFVNSPSLPKHSFYFFHLENVNRQLIDEYTGKWSKARRLSDRESSEVRKVLKEKLDQPHLRELTKNTMQLTILLSLIHTRGSSLPDKRTALYDSYIELFFNRESEKSEIVRDNRDLLISIHRYLAWLLHTESEQGRETGNISAERMERVLKDYLRTNGYSQDLAGILFTGMTERVVAIVSRVEGTYEFEVQPLREYFAARYLYETAPYSPPGNERKGTKPDRFDAIAKNFYWLNVTRFYAGCYSVGELPSLIDRMQELINDPDFTLVRHPRSLASMLLSDWVFAQHPKSVQQIIKIILVGLGLRRLLLSSSRYSNHDDSLVLSPQNGKDELLAQCFNVLDEKFQFDYYQMIIETINNNASKDDIMRYWDEYMHKNNNVSLQWLEHGLNLGVLSVLDSEKFSKIISEHGVNNNTLSLIFKAKRFKYLEENPDVFERIIDAILKTELSVYYRPNVTHSIEKLQFLLSPQSYSTCFHDVQPESLLNRWTKRFGMSQEKFIKTHYSTLLFQKELSDTMVIANNEAKRSMQEWASSIEPWNNLVEGLRKIWGDHWSFVRLAVLSGGVKMQFDVGVEFNDLFNNDLSICLRIRYARTKAGVASWWQKQLAQAETKQDKMFFAVVLSTWAGPTVLIQFLSDLDNIIKDLNEDEWEKVYLAMSSSITSARDRVLKIFSQDITMLFNGYDGRDVTVDFSSLLNGNSHRFVPLLRQPRCCPA